MKLDAMVRQYLCHHAPGMVVRHNARAGVQLRLHTMANVRRMMVATNRAFSALPDARRTPLGLQSCLDDERFHPSATRGVVPGTVGLPHFGHPDISSLRLATLSPLGRFSELISQNDKDRLKRDYSITFDPDNMKLDKRQEMRLRKLPAHQRDFSLSEFTSGGVDLYFGYPILWFTTLREIWRLRRETAKGESVTDRLRDALGLVMRPTGHWQVLVTFPGSVVQSVGHYRPVFCDSGGYPRFMVRSSSTTTRDALWGQTADLRAVAEGHPDCDGAMERVALRMTAVDFSGAKLRFRLLGRLQTTRGDQIDPSLPPSHRESTAFFAERLGQMTNA